MDMNTSDVISLISKIRQKVNGFIVSELTSHGVEGIVVSHGDILFALYRRDRMTMADIARQISKDKSTVTSLVDKLIKLGYVTKERDTKDCTEVYVGLTTKGKDLEPIFQNISKHVVEVFYQNISERDKEELLRILTLIDGNFDS